MANRSISVLFVSRENAVRSIVAEACLNHLGKEKFKAYSCGVPGLASKPVPEPVLSVLASSALPFKDFYGKPWTDFIRSGAPHLDFVISLDSATVRSHPSWPGQPATALWSCLPVLTENFSESKFKITAQQTLYLLRRRIELLVALPMHGLDRSALRSDIRDMAHMP